jgi:glycosyltransferase involved in cell wall biosynthesis
MIGGKTGFLTESNDMATFTQKLRLLIENKELRDQMGEEGYKFASTKFSKQKEIENTKEFYLGLLKEKRRPK